MTVEEITALLESERASRPRTGGLLPSPGQELARLEARVAALEARLAELEGRVAASE